MLKYWNGESLFGGSLLLFVVALTVPLSGFAESKRPISIENPEIKQPGEYNFSGGVRLEKERTLGVRTGTGGGTTGPSGGALEYDNLRTNIVNFRTGLMDNLELSVGVTHSINDAVSENVSTPDQSGIEGIEIGGKLGLLSNLSSSFKVRFNGSQDLFPHGADNPVLDLNFPFKLPLIRGDLYGEFGGKFQGGDVENENSTTIGDWNDSINFGLAYVLPLNQLLDFHMELTAQSAPYDLQTLDEESLIDFNVGTSMQFAPQLSVRPSVGVALSDGSPNFSAGLQYNMEFGSPYEPDQEVPQGEQRYSEKSSYGEPMQKVLDDPETPETRDQQQSLNQESRLKELTEQAFQAADDDNLNRAITLYERAADIEPNNHLIQSNLGSLYFRRGNYEKARNHYRKAVQQSPQDTVSLLYLGASNYHLGNTDLARRYFRRVLELDPDNQQVQRWLDRL